MDKTKTKKVWYKRWWAIVLFIFIGFSILGNFVSEPKDVSETTTPPQSTEITAKESPIPSTETKGEPLIECVEKWSCTNWEPIECPSSATQTRSCKDSNNCGTTNSKPSEKKTCTYIERVIEMTTEQIFKEFSDLTELQIEEKIKEFKGKRIKTSIYVSKIDKASLSSQYVAMEMYEYPYNLMPYVKAFFPAEEKDNLLKTNIGDTLVFSGEFVTYKKGGLTSYIEFTKSKVIEIKKSQ